LLAQSTLVNTDNLWEAGPGRDTQSPGTDAPRPLASPLLSPGLDEAHLLRARALSPPRQ